MAGRNLVGACLALGVVVGWSGVGHPRAQSAPAPPWVFEDVAPLSPVPGCVTGMTLAGFDHDPDGRPVVAWREENGCSGGGRVFWTRKTDAAWATLEFLSERTFQGGGQADYSHQLALRPADGNPFLVYTDVGPNNGLNTYRTDLGAHPEGGVSEFLEHLIGPQNCAYTKYSLSFGPGALVPSWATGLQNCSGRGPLRISGDPLADPVEQPTPALAVTADGTRHLLWNSLSHVYYTARPAGVSGPLATLPEPMFTTVNRFGGEVLLQADPLDPAVLHAVVRGVEGEDADWDRGAVVYVRSSDGGASWSAYEHVDPNDAIPHSVGINEGVSLAIDPWGTPAVTYWRGNTELWFARRDGPGGTWRRSLVTVMPDTGTPASAQVDFDKSGQPVIAYFDAETGWLRLAGPAPAGYVPALDVAVRARVTPAASPAGGPVTYTLTVTNHSAVHVRDVRLTHELPAGATMMSATPAPGPDGSWQYSQLTAGASRHVTVVATAPFGAGDHTSTARATMVEPDVNGANDEASTVLTVRPDACFVPKKELTGWWRGEGDAANALVGLPGGVLEGPVTYAEGASGLGFLFNGVDTGVVIEHFGDDNFYYPREGSFTVQAWIKTASPGGVIASRYECTVWGCRGTAWTLGLDNGAVTAFMRRHDSPWQSAGVTGTRRVDDGALHHVALVLDRDTAALRVFVDGVEDGSAPFPYGAVEAADPLRTPIFVGMAHDSHFNRIARFTGLIDELAIHARALTATELLTLAGAPSERACGAPNHAPEIPRNPGDQVNVEGDTVLIPVFGRDPDGDPIQWSATGLPDGIAIDPATGDMAGTLSPRSAGVHAVTVTASDGALTGAAAFTWTVEDRNRPPVLTAPPDRTDAEGAVLTLPIEASDPDEDSLTYHAAGLPPGLELDAATGVIGGKIAYTAGGTHAVTLGVHDGQAWAFATFAWDVTDTNRAPVAVADSLTVLDANSRQIVPVLANDADPDGDLLAVSAIVVPSAHGRAEIVAGGIEYEPDSQYAGQDAFTYEVTDGRGGSATAVVTISTPPEVMSDLRVTVSAPAFGWISDGYVQFAVTIRNDGPAAAAAVHVSSSTFFGGLGTVHAVIDDAAPGEWCWPSGATISCHRLSVPAGGERSLQVRAWPALSRPDLLEGTIFAFGDRPDPNPDNNLAPVRIELRRAEADLAVSLASSAATYAVGNSVTFTVSVENRGPAPSFGALVTTTLDGSQAPGAEPPAGCVRIHLTEGDEQWQCNLEPLAAGATWSGAFTRVSQREGTRTSDAAVEPHVGVPQDDPDASNNRAVMTTTAVVPPPPPPLARQADLGVATIVAGGTPTAGRRLI